MTTPNESPDTIKWYVNCIPDFKTETLLSTVSTQVVDMAPVIVREIANLKDKATRRALIALGWTPPDISIQPEMERLRKMERAGEELAKALNNLNPYCSSGRDENCGDKALANWREAKGETK